MTATRTTGTKYPAYPAYKDSGVAWLGDVPAHWELPRLKHIAAFAGGGTPSKDNTDFWSGDIPWVSPKDMKTEYIADTEDHVTAEAISASSTKMIDAGAVLLVVRSGILRHSIPVAITARPVALNQDMKAILPNARVDARYLAWLVRGNQPSMLVEWRKTGATVESIEHELLANTASVSPRSPNNTPSPRSSTARRPGSTRLSPRRSG